MKEEESDESTKEKNKKNEEKTPRRFFVTRNVMARAAEAGLSSFLVDNDGGEREEQAFIVAGINLNQSSEDESENRLKKIKKKTNRKVGRNERKYEKKEEGKIKRGRGRPRKGEIPKRGRGRPRNLRRPKRKLLVASKPTAKPLPIRKTQNSLAAGSLMLTGKLGKKAAPIILQRPPPTSPPKKTTILSGDSQTFSRASGSSTPNSNKENEEKRSEIDLRSGEPRKDDDNVINGIFLKYPKLKKYLISNSPENREGTYAFLFEDVYKKLDQRSLLKKLIDQMNKAADELKERKDADEDISNALKTHRNIFKCMFDIANRL